MRIQKSNLHVTVSKMQKVFAFLLLNIPNTPAEYVGQTKRALRGSDLENTEEPYNVHKTDDAVPQHFILLLILTFFASKVAWAYISYCIV